MVNEEKVILMTKIAMYKESLGREDLEKGKYFQSDYVKVASSIVGGYAVVCIAFALFAWVLYTYRYMKAKPKLIKYNQNLKKLIEFYENEDGTRRSVKKKRRAN